MNPTTLDEIRDAVIEWCTSITGRTVVLANTGQQARLNVPYIEVFIDNYDSPVFQKSTISDDGSKETIAANTFLSITLDIFGENSLQDASKLQRSLWSQKRFLDLWLICGLSSVENTIDLTSLQTGTRRQRGQFKFLVYCVLSNDFDSDTIETIELDLGVNDRGNFDITFTDPDVLRSVKNG